MSKIPPYQQLVSFRSLDNYLQQNKKNPQIFIQLFQRKEKMIKFIQQKKIDAEMYKKLLVKKYTKTTDTDLKSLIQMDLLSLKDIHDDKVDPWFQDCINQTGQCYQEQKSLYEKHLNSPKKGVKQPQQIKPAQKQKVQEADAPFLPQQVVNFRGLDNFMQQYKDNKAIFDKLFKNKEKLIGFVNQKKLTPEKYKNLLNLKLGQIKNAQCRSLVEMDMGDLQDLHDGNVQQWFKDLYSQTLQVFPQQQTIFKGVKKPTKKNSQLDDMPKIDIPQIDMKSILKQKQEQKIVAKSQVKQVVQKSELKKIQSKVSTSNINSKSFINFKMLDQMLDNNKAEAQKYIQLFQKKQAMFQKIPKMQLTGQIYFKLLKNAFQSCQDEDIKFNLQMELSDLDSLHDGDKQKWFQDLVNQSGEYYEQQMKIYNIHKNPLSKQTSVRKTVAQQQLIDPTSKIRGSTRIRLQQRIQPTDQRYSVNQICSFTALAQLLNKYIQKDKQYFNKLQQKKGKLLKLVINQQMQPQSYKILLTKTIAKVKTPYLNYMMKQQLRSLDDQFDSNQDAWFLYVTKRLKESTNTSGRKSLAVTKIGGVSKLTDPQLLQATPKVKIQYLIRQISKYQGVFVFLKNNDLQKHAYDFAVKYYKPLRDEVLGYKQQLQKGNAQKIQKIDVVQFRNKRIKQIDFQKFHAGMDKNAYINEIQNIMKKVKETQTQFKKYSAGIKKATNTKNIEESKKIIDRTQQDLNYLKSLANKQFVPLPKLQIKKVQKYNLDINDLQPDQMEISIDNITGINAQLNLKVFLLDKKERITKWVKNGSQKISFKCKIPQNQMEQIIKGTQQKILIVRLFQKGWFGSQKLIAQEGVPLNFIKTNTYQDKIDLKNGQIRINFTAKVQKPKRPILTAINDYEMTKYPEYQYNNKIEEQFIKKHMPFVNPTQSQIMS